MKSLEFAFEINLPFDTFENGPHAKFLFLYRDSNSGPLHHDRSGSSSSSNNNTVGKTKYAYILQCFALVSVLCIRKELDSIVLKLYSVPIFLPRSGWSCSKKSFCKFSLVYTEKSLS